MRPKNFTLIKNFKVSIDEWEDFKRLRFPQSREASFSSVVRAALDLLVCLAEQNPLTDGILDVNTNAYQEARQLLNRRHWQDGMSKLRTEIKTKEEDLPGKTPIAAAPAKRLKKTIGGKVPTGKKPKGKTPSTPATKFGKAPQNQPKKKGKT